MAQDDPSIFFTDTELDRDRTERIVADALSDCDDGELFLEYRQSEALVFDDGRLKSASFDTTQGFGLRAVAGEATGYAHASELSEAALKRAASSVDAVKAGHSGEASDAPPGTNRTLYVDDNPLSAQGFEDKVALLQEIDAYARGLDTRVGQVSASLTGNWQAVELVRADGTVRRDIRPLVRLNVSVVANAGERQESGSYGIGGRTDYSDILDGDTWKACADEALRQALVNLDSVDAPAGEMDVVLGSGWPGILLHEAIGHGLEGDFNRKKTSAFAGLMGERIASPGVTVVDDGTLTDRRGSLTIDDEGTPTSSTTLIEDGILVGFMHDRLNARLMGEQPTGNGRRQSYAHMPMPRMTNTYMLSGDADPDEIIAVGEIGPLRGLLRRRPGRHHERQVRVLLHRGLHDRGRQARRAGQGRDAYRQRAGRPHPGHHGRQRHGAGLRDRHLRQGRPERAGRRRPGAMNLIEILAQAQGGGAMDNLSRQFGLDATQTKSAVEQLAPMIAAGFRRNAGSEQGLVDLMQALQGGNHQRYVDDASALGRADTVNEGNGILGHIFGSKDVSREVASQAASSTGISSGILKQMLPIIASMIMGSMSKRTREPGLQDILGSVLGGMMSGGGNRSSSSGGGDVLGSLLGGLMSAGDEAAKQPGESRARQPSVQDIFGDMLDDGSGGSAADDLLNSVLRHTRR